MTQHAANGNNNIKIITKITEIYKVTKMYGNRLELPINRSGEIRCLRLVLCSCVKIGTITAHFRSQQTAFFKKLLKKLCELYELYIRVESGIKRIV